MNIIRKKIEAVMYSGGESQLFLLESLLFVFSVLYGILVKIRCALYSKGIFKQKRLPCKVISVGNVTVGGTGKTPMTIYLAKLLVGYGYKVAVVSRGYRGKFEKKGGIVSNGKEMLMGPELSGDEPFMMAARLENIPVVVGQNRYESGWMAIKNFDIDIILLDDGFQHIKLFRDIDILLLDHSRPFGNFHLIPRGILREPAASAKRADTFILTRSSSDNSKVLNLLNNISKSQAIFETYNSYYFFNAGKESNADWVSIFGNELSKDYDRMAGKKVVAFSGIAVNEHFRKTIEEFKCELVNFYGFPDHYYYSADDIEKISQSAKKQDAQFIITTEKDFARMGGKYKFPVDLIVVGSAVHFKDDNSFKSFIMNKLVKTEAK
ncbi:MAG: tetraacyldisaccharide 4'-kinase [Desulfobacterium sp.]|nr:tetraacyldisaccharide 4'-kinase [Desulfobacterium sp.]MBU4010996.1 tetraacyldisaccharide 4'-kinase [Pseudomonadota bacterium]MBU4036347.1 tetraacyldisaccharide 4'-kinase [Pseudomonadota bacterium]